MILYMLLKSVLFILGVISNIIGQAIIDFPDAINNVLTTISTMVNGGISFLSYFFHIPVVVALISLVIAWHGFRLIKDAIFKVIGHFIGN